MFRASWNKFWASFWMVIPHTHTWGIGTTQADLEFLLSETNSHVWAVFKRCLLMIMRDYTTY